MKVIVAGDRNFRSPAQVFRKLDELHKEYNFTRLMQGGAAGVDSFARDWAIARRIQHYVCKADWNRYGNSAGPIRNRRMLQWGPDLVVAFPGGTGTANMVKIAVTAGIKVIKVLGENGDEIIQQKPRRGPGKGFWPLPDQESN